jgi:hypothetical protein
VPQANEGKIHVEYHGPQVLHMFLTAADEAKAISHSYCIRVVRAVESVSEIFQVINLNL